jgi:signal transduction histidine kinase
MIRSAAYRIAIVYAAAFAVAVLVLGVGVYWAADRALRAQFDDRIAAEVSSLVSEYRSEGSASLRMVIARRETSRATNDLGYALYATDGRRIGGLLDAPRPKPGWQSLVFRDPVEGPDDARALAVTLSDDETLVVAADWEELETTEHLIMLIFAGAFAMVVVIGLVGAALLGLYLRRRLSAISGTAETIVAGDLATRIPVGSRGDEFDRLSQALNAMLDRIAELLDNLRQVSSDVAHDLRSPLSRLRNALEEGLRAEDKAQVIERALADADDVLAVFAAILRLSEIESGRLRRDFAGLDLSALASEIAESYQPVIEDGGRTLSAAVEPGMTITGDRELIAQALVNLLDNAQIHTPVGTAITLGLTRSAGAIRLTVADDGPGVPADDRDRITRRFTRLEASRSRPGNGLGLSLVAAIARVHGAGLDIEDATPGLAVALVFRA